MTTSQAARSTHSEFTFGGLGQSDWLWLLAAVAGLRVFFLLSAFPFFGNIDEVNHIDLIQRYASDLSGMKTYPDAMAQWFVLYDSPEYNFTEQTMPKGPPNYTIVNFASTEELEQTLAEARRLLRTNHELGSPPIYYFLSACWLHVGMAVGVSGLHLLYWLRLPNVPAIMALVWIGFVFTRRWFPQRPPLAWGVAILLATMPQDVFYVVNPDVLTAVLFPLAMHWTFVYGHGRSAWQAVVAGLMISVLMLVKLSNIPILVPMAVVSVAVLLRRRTDRSLTRDAASLAPLWLLPGVILGAWMIWNKATVGDWTATAERFATLGWTAKPVREMFDHPILGPSGLGYFLSRLTTTFWHGESVWLSEWLHRPWMDALYVFTSLVFVGVAVIAVVAWRIKGQWTHEPWGTMIATVATAVLWMAYLSMRFDFGPCLYPSRELPYFVSGRLIFGIAVPFAVLYVGGLSILWSKLAGNVTFLPVLIGFMVLANLVDLQMTIPMFSSPYNWYRLWP